MATSSKANAISIVLTVDDVDFRQRFQQAQETIRNFEKSNVSMASKVGGAIKGGLGVAIGAAGGLVKALTSVRGILLSTLAIAGTAKFVGQFKESSEYVDQLGKKARVLGVSTEFLSGLAYTADLAGIEFNELAKMSGKAMKEVAEAVQKGQRQIAGVRLVDVGGQIRPIQELLPEFAKAIASVRDQAEKLRLGEQIFGRAGGTQFVQLIEESGDALQRLPKLMAEAKQTGAVFTTEQTQRAAALNDSWRRIQIAVRGVRFTIADELAPALTKMFNATADRVGDLANAIPKIAAMLREIAGGSQDPVKREAIGEFINSAATLLRVAVTEALVIAVTAGIKVMEAGIVALGPSIADVFRDNLGPVVNKTLGIEIVAPSAAGRAKLLREELQKLQPLLAKIAASEDNLANNPHLDGADRSGEEARLVGLRNELKRGTGSTVEDLMRKIAAAEGDAERELSTRRQVLAQVLADTGKELAEAAEKGGDRVAVASERMRAAAAKLDEAFEASGGGRKKLPSTSIYTLLEGYVLTGGKRLQDAMRFVTGGVDSEGKRTLSVWQKFMAMGKDFRAQSTALQARLLDAQGLDRQADRLRLVFKQAEELRKAEAFYGKTNPLTNMLRDVQVAELSKFDRGPKKEKGDPKTFAEGWGAAIKRIEDDTKDWGVFTRDTLSNSVKGFSDSWAQALVDGEITFKNFGKKLASILGDVLKQGLSAVLSRVLYGAIGGAVGQIYRGAPAVEVQSNPSFGPSAPGSNSAYGNAFSRGSLVPFAWGGHTTNGPEVFPMSRGRWGLRGENAQDEGVFPLVRKGGILGVRATGMGGGTTVNVIDQRSGGSPVQVRESIGAGGSKQIEVLIRDAVQKSVADGSMDRILGSTYGLRRKGTR